MLNALRRAPLSFHAGVAIGALLATAAFCGAMLWWAVWVIRHTYL